MRARFHPRADEFGGAMQVDDPETAKTVGQALPVGFLQRRAGDDRVFLVWQDPIQPIQPGPAVLVLERRAGRHPGDVLGRMVVIGVDEAAAEPARERLADGGLAGARYAHHHHDHGPLWTACPPKRARIMAMSLRVRSERPWLEKRAISAVVITGVGMPSSIDSSAVQRPEPESSTTGAMPERSSFSFRIVAHRSSSHERTTLP